ncbi:hypothetical protein D9M72_543550 [compost metagenome]
MEHAGRQEPACGIRRRSGEGSGQAHRRGPGRVCGRPFQELRRGAQGRQVRPRDERPHANGRARETGRLQHGIRPGRFPNLRAHCQQRHQGPARSEGQAHWRDRRHQQRIVVSGKSAGVRDRHLRQRWTRVQRSRHRPRRRPYQLAFRGNEVRHREQAANQGGWPDPHLSTLGRSHG